jgi:TetR/AcrR family transcriptional regulator, tetracycline repressor protein
VLDLVRITQAAVELLDEVGLAELSTRRLAAKLGVRSPTLYWHVRDKAELLDLVAEAICADAFRIDETQPWREQLTAGLRQFRGLLLRHRDAAQLLGERPPTGPHRLGHIDTTVGILLRAGFDADESAAISRLLTAHVLNSVEPPRRDAEEAIGADVTDYPNLRRVAPAFARQTGEEVFELGIEVILDGLEVRLR